MKMATKADSSPETEILEKSNDHGGRRCPKCGTLLGQKNICPFCSGQNEEKTEAQNDSAAAPEESAPAFKPMERLQHYQQLKQSLAGNPKDFAFVLQCVRTIQRDFVDYLHLDYKTFYPAICEAKCPFAVFAALMDPEWNAIFRSILKFEWRGDSNSRSLFVRYEGRFDRLYAYAFNPVAFSALNDDYLDLLDTSWNRDDPAKPIKHISVYAQSIENWHPIVPSGKRVLILHCGKEIQVKGSNPPVSENEGSGQADSSQSQTENFHLFEIYDGLQFRQKMNGSSSSKDWMDYALLYVVEP